MVLHVMSAAAATSNLQCVCRVNAVWRTPHLSVLEADKKCMGQINQVTNALIPLW